MKVKKKKIIFAVISILCSLIVAEVGLQFLSLISHDIDTLLTSEPDEPRTISDKRLGLRPNLEYPGHDRNGFRNKFVPEKVSVVCMGDSQTYGILVETDQAWPQQLARLGKMTTYNMASGGYSAAHSLILLEEALALQPKLIIEAFYAGNDLYEAFALVHHKDQLPQLKLESADVSKAVSNFKQDSLSNKTETKSQMTIKEKQNVTRKFGILRKFLADYSKLYGILRLAKDAYILKNDLSYYDWESIKREVLKNKVNIIIENGPIKSVLTPYNRFRVLNQKDARIVEGHRICLEAVRLMHKKTKELNIEFIVLFIPTKELVFKDITYKHFDDIPEIYKALIENEMQMWQKTREFLNEHNIGYIDSLPVLRRRIQEGRQPYRICWDGHPNSKGNRALAELVLSEINEKNLLKTTQVDKNPFLTDRSD